MKKMEIIIIALAVVTFVLKWLHIPWSATAVFIVLLILALFYYSLGFALFNKIRFNRILKKESYVSIPGIRLVLSVAYAWVFSMVVIGVLFKIEHLPYAGYMLVLGMASAALLQLVFIFNYFRQKSDFYKHMAIRTALIFVFWVWCFF